MGKRRRGKKEIVSSISLEPREKSKKYESTKQGKCTMGLNQVTSEDDNSMCLDAEQDWIMQTSSGYEYDIYYEDTIRRDSWDTNQAPEDTDPITMETAITGTGKSCEKNKNVQQNKTTKTESRAEKIKSLKALRRKQEKAVNKLNPDARNSSHKQTSVSVSAVDNCDKSSKTNCSTAAKGCRGGLGNKPRRSRRRKVESNDATSYRDVDIWICRGDLMTKDEFLACVGLVRVAKFHYNS